MKKLSALLLSVLSIFTCCGEKQEKPTLPLTYIAYSYGSQMLPYRDTDMAFEQKGDSVYATIFNIDSLTYYRYLITQPDVMQKFRQIIIEEKMYKYKDHYTNPNVLDGDGWSFHAVFKDQVDDRHQHTQSIYTGGSNKWPKGEGLSRISAAMKSALEGAQFLYICDENGDPEAQITAYRDGKDCAVSFTFDDGMLCHYTDIAPELEKRGFLGTFWIIGANMGKQEPDYPWMTWTQVADLAKRGHEMSNHTWNHPSLPQLTIEEVAKELSLCDDKLQKVTGQRPITMAYPYNAMSPEVVALCEKGRVGTRTFQVGQGQKESHCTLDSMKVWLRGVIRAGEWGVTMTHGTTYGWDMWDDPQQLYQFFDYVKSRQNDVWVGTFAQVASYIKERDAATVSSEYGDDHLRIYVNHTLDPTLFTEPLTVAIHSLKLRFHDLTAEQGGHPVEVTSDGEKIFVNVMPGDEPVVIKW